MKKLLVIYAIALVLLLCNLASSSEFDPKCYVSRFADYGRSFYGFGFDEALNSIRFEFRNISSLSCSAEPSVSLDAMCVLAPRGEHSCPAHVLIILDRSLKLSGDIYREEVIFHELGHCFLILSHDESIEGGRPKSIMHSHKLDWKTYFIHRQEYLRELFFKPTWVKKTLQKT